MLLLVATLVGADAHSKQADRSALSGHTRVHRYTEGILYTQNVLNTLLVSRHHELVRFWGAHISQSVIELSWPVKEKGEAKGNQRRECDLVRRERERKRAEKGGGERSGRLEK